MQIYILKNNEQTGPYDESQVARMLDASEISYDDLGWFQGMDEWKALRRIARREEEAVSSTPPPRPVVSQAESEKPRRPSGASLAFCFSLACLAFAGGVVYHYTTQQSGAKVNNAAAIPQNPGGYSKERVESLFAKAINGCMAATPKPSPAESPATMTNWKCENIQIRHDAGDCYFGTATLAFEANCAISPDGKAEQIRPEISVIGYSGDKGKTWHFLGVAPDEWNWFAPLAGNIFQTVSIPPGKLFGYQNGTWTPYAQNQNHEPAGPGHESDKSGGTGDDANWPVVFPDTILTTLGIASQHVYALQDGRWLTREVASNWTGEQPGANAAGIANDETTPANADADVQATAAEPAFTTELFAIKKAAESGNPRALGITAALWQSGYPGMVDPKSATEAALTSADQGSPFGQYALARIYGEGAAPDGNNRKSQEMGTKAGDGLKSYADSGDAWAEMFLGSLAELGIGTRKDPVEAQSWYRKSAGHGNLLAEMSLAKLLAMQKSMTAPPPAALPANLTILILGDSMSLCGFGESLDQRFRNSPQVKSTFTYMACGTNPLSWLQGRPGSGAMTHCGFWSIESVPSSKRPSEFQDTYGMKRGYSPNAHPVPKLEELLSRIKPDILVMQCGTNLFDLFEGRKVVRPDHDRPLLRNYIFPFIAAAVNSSAPLRKIYWVASPTDGRVPGEIQDFVFEQICACAAPLANVIDSRQLVSYPYQHMQPDHEHFIGADMDHWADKVFNIIQQDISSQPFYALHTLKQLSPILASNEFKTPDDPPVGKQVLVSAKLAFKSKPYEVAELLPYQESLVSFVYDVKTVIEGEYTDKQVLVMHPAHIRLKKQPLDKYRVGEIYKLRLHDLEDSPWSTVKCKDDSNLIDLQPYIQIEDENRFPTNPH